MILVGDVLEQLSKISDNTVHCAVTSPPYWGLRDYGVEGQIGLESTMQEYIVKMVEVFREVRRVLRSDGVCFLNLGDSYGTVGNRNGLDNSTLLGKTYGRGCDTERPKREQVTGLKPKDLCGIPWRVALALQDDGWWLRSDIIWNKANPMPESVGDRPTKSHEYIFLLTKSSRYFWDQEAVREGFQGKDERQWASNYKESGSIIQGESNANIKRTKRYPETNGRNLRTVWNIPTESFSGVVTYGTCRIASPDCPVHDYQEDYESVLLNGEQQVVSQIARNLGIGGDPFLMQEGVAVAIPLDHHAFPSDDFFAMRHSKQIHKNGLQLGPGEIFYGISSYHNEHKKFLDRFAAKFFRNHGSSISAGASQDVSGTGLLAQIPSHIVGILTFQAPPFDCKCHYIGKVENRQDHFACFPQKLVETCIKAGTSEWGCCPECGKPWVRVVEKAKVGDWRSSDRKMDLVEGARGGPGGEMPGYSKPKTLGFKPSCACPPAEPIPCTVLDPFLGSGTTALVAQKMGRHWIGIELNPEYAAMAKKRLGTNLFA